MKIYRLAALTAVGLAVAACGGGGDSSPSAALTSVPFTTANYDPTGRATAALVIDVQSSTNVEGVASAEAVEVSVLPPSDTFSISRMVAGLGAAALNGRERPTASSSATDQCTYGGSVSVTANDNNNNNRADAGDSVTSNFSGCVTKAGAPAINGGMDFTISSVTYSGSNLTGLGLAVTLRSLSSGGSTVTGNADLSLTESTASITYRDTTSVRGGKTTVYNFTALSTAAAGSGNSTITVSGQVGISGAAYTLSTPTSIVMGSVYPTSGILKVADAAGGYVNIVMRPTNFDLDLYLPGDAVRDAQATYTWAALAAGTI